MTRTVAPYGLDDPAEYDHSGQSSTASSTDSQGSSDYSDFTAMLAGHLVERNDGLDILLDVLARHCESEYGLSSEDRSTLSRALAADTNLMEHTNRVLDGHEEWVLDNTYSDIDRADLALYADVVTELRDFVAQRYTEVNE